jgi:ribonuclease HIII
MIKQNRTDSKNSSVNGNSNGIDDYKNRLSAEMKKLGLLITEEKTIAYGLQIVISNGEHTLPVNLYRSQKKGLSVVIGGNDRNPLKSLMDSVVSGTGRGEELTSAKKESQIHRWESWLGTDEAGKGEFYGALVVAGFQADREIIPELMKLGIQDSKNLTAKKIETAAHQLYKEFKGRIEVVSLKPETYNKLYRDFTAKGKKLNELLAWMHGRVILNLQEKTKEYRVVVDKFTSDKKLIDALRELQKIELLQVTKAEQDLAVAAASIIARYHYLESLKLLNKKFKIDFKSGSGAASIDTGVEFVKRYSLARLQEAAKIHFKNYQKIEERIKGEFS